jgi:hypothetical protein
MLPFLLCDGVRAFSDETTDVIVQGCSFRGFDRLAMDIATLESVSLAFLEFFNFTAWSDPRYGVRVKKAKELSAFALLFKSFEGVGTLDAGLHSQSTDKGAIWLCNVTMPHMAQVEWLPLLATAFAPLAAWNLTFASCEGQALFGLSDAATKSIPSLFRGSTIISPSISACS